MKIIISAKAKKKGKGKKYNEYAACTESIGNTEGTTERSEWSEDAKDRYGRCLKHLNPKKHKKKANKKIAQTALSNYDIQKSFDGKYYIVDLNGHKMVDHPFETYEEAEAEIIAMNGLELQKEAQVDRIVNDEESIAQLPENSNDEILKTNGQPGYYIVPQGDYPEDFGPYGSIQQGEGIIKNLLRQEGMEDADIKAILETASVYYVKTTPSGNIVKRLN